MPGKPAPAPHAAGKKKDKKKRPATVAAVRANMVLPSAAPSIVPGPAVPNSARPMPTRPARRAPRRKRAR